VNSQQCGEFMTKKIQRDEKGHPIVSGAKTFGNITKPLGGKRAARGFDLKSKGADRIINLMQYGPRNDKFNIRKKFKRNKQEETALTFQENFASLPHPVKFAYYNSRRLELQKELKELFNTNNKRKINIMEPAIRIELKWIESQMMDIYNAWQKER